jgi:RNA polymerase sigma factor (TIGR02999 family)
LAADGDVTRLLRAWGDGDEAALADLVPLVYDEIHRIAHRLMSHERAGHALQTTALVSEVYLRLIDVHGVDWQNRTHFFALCARLMRRVMVDYARSRNSKKRDGRVSHVELDEGIEDRTASAGADLLAVDEALRKLQAVDERKARVVELRFFGGLTTEEIAGVLDVSPETVLRDWRMARAWLSREIDPGTPR